MSSLSGLRNGNAHSIEDHKSTDIASARVLTFMAAEELDSVDEPRVERGGPPHPGRPGAPLRH
jgi:hypothetical protein